MANKNENFFFDSFESCAQISFKAAKVLKRCLDEYDSDRVMEQLEEMHIIENDGDSAKHDVMHELVRAFITPIERDDIVEICNNIDNVTDSIEDVLIQFYMNNITHVKENAKKFADIVVECCDATTMLMHEFRTFRKSKKLAEIIIEINRLEEDGDRLYLKSMRELTLESENPFEFIAWREIYSYLEKCCDACEDVADIVESIAIGNS